MELQNPNQFLMDYYYNNKYVLKKKTFKHKTVNYFIAHLHQKTHSNKKFKKINIVFNPFCSFYLKRNITNITEDELTEMMNKIDKCEIINNCSYHFIEYYKKAPINQYQFYSLKNYNFYDMLLFEYCSHRDRERIWRELSIFKQNKLKVIFD
tara:strand:+ start:651 stop:1106 length:456 start_codon:yes stop_codon:yes gene_type:complete